MSVLLSSRPGLGLEDSRKHHLEVLAYLGLEEKVLALALDRGQGQDHTKTWKSPEHFLLSGA